MKMRRHLLETGLAVWLMSTMVTAVVLFTRSVNMASDAFRVAWTSLWIGALVSMPLAAALAVFRSRHVAATLAAILEMTQAMLSGVFRERFFPETGTELDTLGADLDRLAASLRARMHDLQDSDAKLDATLNASISGIIIIDSEGTVSALNQAAQDILGRSEADLRGLSFAEALTSSELASLVYRALYREIPGRQEILVGRRAPRVVDANAAPLLVGYDPNRQVSGVVLTLHDLTEIRRLERMRKDFVQNVSHELRTPVTVVKGFAETLRDTPPDDPETVREMAGFIDAEATRLSSLVDALLNLSRLESGSIVPAKVPLNPGQILRDTVKKLSPLSYKKNQTVTVTEDVPEGSLLQADPSLIDMVFTNLLENAIKYTPDSGEIDVSVRPADGGWLFRVADNGSGIRDEDLPRLFERFYRGSKSRNREAGGTGLGLAVAKHAVTLHSGRIWAENLEGRGSAFFVWLP